LHFLNHVPGCVRGVNRPLATIAARCLVLTACLPYIDSAGPLSRDAPRRTFTTAYVPTPVRESCETTKRTPFPRSQPCKRREQMAPKRDKTAPKLPAFSPTSAT